MKKALIAAALAASALLPAAAQSLDKTPTAKEAQQARDNAKRDQRLADQMEKDRLKQEAQKPAVHVAKSEAPKEPGDDKDRKPVMNKPGKPQYFTAVEPGYRKAKKKEKKSD